MGKGSWSAPSRHRSSGRYKASRPSPSIGWAPRHESASGETVVAVFDRDLLSGVLATLHGSGYGSNIRVLDGARGDLAAQLARANIPAAESDLHLGDRPAESAVVLVHAPGRGERVLALLRAQGPRDIHLVNRPPTTASDQESFGSAGHVEPAGSTLLPADDPAIPAS